MPRLTALPGGRAHSIAADHPTGFYEPVRHVLNRALGYKPEEVVWYTSITAGSITGCIGGESAAAAELARPRPLCVAC